MKKIKFFQTRCSRACWIFVNKIQYSSLNPNRNHYCNFKICKCSTLSSILQLSCLNARQLQCTSILYCLEPLFHVILILHLIQIACNVILTGSAPPVHTGRTQDGNHEFISIQGLAHPNCSEISCWQSQFHKFAKIP